MGDSFNIHKNFMIRSSILDNDFFFTKLDKNLRYSSVDDTLSYLLNMLNKTPFLKEIIAVASNSLYDSISNISLSSKEKDKKKVIKGVFRYLNRSSIRTTPFGLCAKVGVGHFDNSNNTLVTDDKHTQRRVEADIEWVNKLKLRLESDIYIVKNLDIKLNQGILIKGNRAKLNYSSMATNKFSDNYTTTTISYNDVIENIFSLTKNKINFDKLCNKINSMYEEATKEIIEDLLMQLISQEYLITDFEIHNNEPNPLHYLNSVLKSKAPDEKISKKIDIVLEKIEEYQESSWDTGIDHYTSLVSFMKSIVINKNYIKIDLIDEATFSLHKNIKFKIDEVTKYLCDLAYLNNEDSKQMLSDYHNKFLENYGLDREVKILELLDEDLGIGPPSSYEYPPPVLVDDGAIQFRSRKVDEYIFNLVSNAILKEEYEVRLENYKMPFDNKISDHHLPNSLDVYFHLNDEQLILSSNPYSLGAGTTMGRFTKYFNEYYEEWKNILTTMNRGYEDEIWVEVQSTPISRHTENISRNLKRSSYEINIKNTCNNSNNIDLDDIVVISDHHRLYLKSISLNKIIKPISSNMLNPNLTPNVNRLLLEIGYQDIGESFPYHFTNINNMNLPFLPRITFKGVVLVPAKWNIFQYEINSLDSFESFVNSFTEVSNQKKVPKIVYMSNFDNKILFNLNNMEHLYQLYTEFKKINVSSSITFEETFFNEGNKQSIQHELVFSLTKSQMPTQKNHTNSYSHLIPNTIRYKEPFNEWIYLKLYISEERENEFLSTYLREYVNSQEWFDKFFYMRYRDPKFHIRLRFKAPKNNLIDIGLPQILSWISKIKDTGIINDFEFSTYNREVERYGGVKVIDDAESVFFADSLLSLELLNIANKYRFVNLDYVYMLSINNYLSKFNFSTNQKLDWLNQRINYKDYLKEFRKNKDVYENINTQSLCNLLQEVDKDILNNIYSHLNKAILNYTDRLNEAEAEDFQVTSSAEILDSLIHLHHNRLIGINRDNEIKYLTLFRHSLYSENERAKHSSNSIKER